MSHPVPDARSLRFRIGAGLGVAVLTLGLGVTQLKAATEQAIAIDDATFDCLTAMTAVRGFFVDNLLGNLEATVAAAESPDGAMYPTGSVVQLVPTEVMVKQTPGTSPATNDWEFFELQVSEEGSTIVARGFVDVVNRFGGNCFGCHVKAEPKWDLICETGHGCDPLPITRDVIAGIQQADPRCRAPEEV
ncbi:MAG: hypothetical protein A3H44_05740 [Gammaproteobacteria bacterium RIFCSPLOWO2_02_FULL_57_10]|nr:MAG: hypothetical protein A3H44_05740 [Gammaproteobacteria bacterium RIFCSPLOWO2_02_FULL_57_10]